MTRVILRNTEGMKLNGRPPSNISGFSDDEDAVHSGSATGFSDGDPADLETSQSKPQRSRGSPFDPVNTILDKIDAELVSLTRSQSSTATDSTVVHRPHSQPSSADHSRLEHGDGLSISQLGSIHPRSFSPPTIMRTGSSDRDTGFGSYDSLQHRRAPSPEMVYKDGRHVYQNGHHGRRKDDDKASHGPDAGTALTLDSKQVDDKFKEIMQKKRKGGYKSSGNEDAETIRTEDFVDKFQDTLVYSSADEQERIKNLEEDVSDGGSDTDTLQRKLAVLTNTSLPEDRSFSRPLRSLEQHRRKLFPQTEIKAFKGTQGTPPVYPKPTPTSSLPRPSRGGVKLSSGFTSDADSVKTEDFESHFNNMMVNQGESDQDTITNDPIHARVKQLLKATAKYEDENYNPYSYPLTTSILKQSYPQDKPHKGPEPFRSKQHVRIDSLPRQFEEQDKGEDSDDTLCSDKEETSHTEPKQAPDRGSSIDETHLEIARESERIRREMEKERRSKSPIREKPAPPPRDRSPTRTFLNLTTMPKSSQEKTQSGKSLSDEEKERKVEYRATQDALQITQDALEQAQHRLRETQAQMEDLRTQLMLAEYKKENTSKELQRLADDVSRKKKQAKTYETQAKTRLEELKQFDSIGFTKDEAMQIIEANESMKNRLRNLDAVHAERDELIQQLEAAKKELFQEQKKARTTIEELKEELETVTNQCEQLQTEKDEAVKKLHKVESGYRKMEMEKNELIQEKTRQYEEEKDKVRSSRHERRRSDEEVEAIRQDLAHMTNKVAILQDQLKEKEELNLQLRDQIIENQQLLEQEKSSRGSILDEHKKTLQTLRKETDSAMVQMRESLFLEKQKTVDTLREELEQERREISMRADERLTQQLTDHAAAIKMKEEEINHLKKMIDRLEKEQATSKVNMQDEMKLQIHEAVNRERQLLEQEHDWQLKQERENLGAEHRHKVKQLQEELTVEIGRRELLEKKLKEAKDELEDVRSANKQAVHEKLIAVARAKELMRQEHQIEVERIREQMKNDHKKEVDKLRETIRIQEEELRQLREDRQRWLRQQKEFGTTFDKTERTLVNEINEECRRTSEVLGLSPRKVNITSFRDNGYISARPGSTSTPTTAALANLRACNEELRSHVEDLKHDLEVQRMAISRSDQEKQLKSQQDEALANLKHQLEREKQQEMERLKEKLVKGLSTNEYRSLLYTPDNDMSQGRQSVDFKYPMMNRQMRQIADRQQQQIDRLEGELKKLAMNQNPALPKNELKEEDITYRKSLQQLQSKVKQLQEENNHLRRAKLQVSSSTPDLSRPDLYNTPHHRKFLTRTPTPSRDQERIASALELRMKDADYETDALRDHHERSRDVMSHKMSEMSKLQNTLTNQAKELIQLEKAYTQLHKYGQSPRSSHVSLR